MNRYNRVPTKFWVTTRGWEDKPRTFALYLYTCEHRTGEGLYRLPLAYAAADLGWTTPVAERQMSGLVRLDFVGYDANAEVVLLHDALEVQVPTGNQIKGAIARLQALPATPLLCDLYAHANAHSNGLAEAMRKGMGMELERALEWVDRQGLNGHSNPHTQAHAHTQAHSSRD